MTIIIILIIILVLAGAFIGIYNSLVRGRNTCEEAFSTMDVYMKKRYDLIPNLVETVKGYAAHERETLEKVIEARQAAVNAPDKQSRFDAEGFLRKRLGQLFAVAERYPELKANENFLYLQSQLEEIENEIAGSRKYYNAVVKYFNIKCESFPSNIVASMFHFQRWVMFEITDETERQPVKVQF